MGLTTLAIATKIATSNSVAVLGHSPWWPFCEPCPPTPDWEEALRTGDIPYC